jgi:two-component system phosphate regulon sensor histidine kinase PhoR
MLFFKRNKYIKSIDALKSAIADLEEKIRRLENENIQMQAILNGMVEGVIAVDKETRILSINPAIEKIFNIQTRDVKGRFFLESIRNNDLSELINSVLDKGDFISRELSLVWPVQKIFQVNAAPIFEKRMISGCLVVIHDISEIRRLEKVRSDFVANASHELKTPLTSIKGFVETLLEGASEDKKNSQHFLKIIQEHAERLDNLINDLLRLSYLESSEIKLEIKTVDLQALTSEVLAGFKSQLKKRSIEAINDLPAKLLVNVDKDRIEQVLINLIDNAIKFNRDKGKIKIYSQELDDRIKFIIEDSGIGIPPKDLPRIFERFYRVDKARSRELSGTGLGLSIVKHIIELHGGTVGVESTEGLGSQFYFYLPR